MQPASRTLEERFWKKVIKTNGCWLWIGSKSEHGYGKIGGRSLGNKQWDSPQIASRVSWEIHNGPIPAGLCVLHHCDNPSCTNPEHLWIGTRIDNNRDAQRKGRNAFGERHGRAKLSATQVVEIRMLIKEGVSQAEISRCFPISKSAVGLIARKQKWRHI
jgi:hypothetical protein